MSDMNLNSLIDLYDSDFFVIEQIAKKLNESSGKLRQVEGFRKEIIERFEEAGLRVDVKTWSTNLDGAYAFDIEIVDRCERLSHGFDHDRQAWEVQNAILGLDDPGSFNRDGRLITPPKNTSFINKS